MSGRAELLRALEGEPDAPLWIHGVLAALAPAGWAYGAAMRLRRWLYESGRWEASSPSVPVVSVGNLTLGGTGKTPTVAWAVARLVEAGRRPAVVSRGYGGALREVAVVGDGAGNILPCPPATDEAVMLARRFPEVPVLTGLDRPAVARHAAGEFGAEVILLDDGFQHIALRRNMDLVLLRGECPFGNGRVFPAGVLREPLSALRRADAILLTGEVDAEARGRVEAAAPGVEVFAGRLVPDVLLDAEGRPAGGPGELADAEVIAVSGVGRPEGFARTLSRLAARVRAHHIFSDHALYTRAEADRLLASFERTGAHLVVATEKDAVKLAPFLGGAPFCSLRVAMQIDRAEELAARILEAASAAQG